jgi:hypothetical protein
MPHPEMMGDGTARYSLCKKLGTHELDCWNIGYEYPLAEEGDFSEPSN